jgi:hypothetical protein
MSTISNKSIETFLAELYDMINRLLHQEAPAQLEVVTDKIKKLCVCRVQIFSSCDDQKEVWMMVVVVNAESKFHLRIHTKHCMLEG